MTSLETSVLSVTAAQAAEEQEIRDGFIFTGQSIPCRVHAFKDELCCADILLQLGVVGNSKNIKNAIFL